MSEHEAANEWIERATEDLRIARLILAEGFGRGASYHVQQAAEKLLKAAIVKAGIRPPRTHDLVSLLTMLPAPSRPTFDLLMARQITDWVISGRYPTGDDPLPTEAEIAASLDAVEALLTSIAG
jgi:HEPN domain-containing protein